MKLRSKLTCGLAVLGMAAGVITAAAPSAFASTSNVHPYIDWGFGLTNPSRDVTGLGATNPGGSDSTICLYFALGTPNASPGDTPSHFTDPTTHTPSYSGGVLETEATLQDLTTVTPCTLTNVGLTFTGVVTPNNAKHTGKEALTFADAVQPGIVAAAQSQFVITHASGQTLVATGGTLSTIDSTHSLLTTPPVATTTKPLATTTCAVVDKALDLSSGNIDSSDLIGFPAHKGTGTPFPKDISAYDPDDSGNWNVATFNTCAQDTTPVAGKPLKIGFTVTGAGSVSVAFRKAVTANPRVWDDTIGACKLASKDKLGNPIQDANFRVLTCKGNYGQPVPFVLSVRGQSAAHATDDPLGLVDPADVNIPEGAMTIT